MKHPHHKEICYWAEHPVGTRVWVKDGVDSKWYLLESHPDWFKSFIYVVNDEWAELRKAQIDGKQLQFKNIDYTLEDYFLDNTLVSDWRIKPEEPEYEWQWICKDKQGYFSITEHHYSDEIFELMEFMDWEIFEKYEPSKRERK